jgi:hypothetical protein
MQSEAGRQVDAYGKLGLSVSGSAEVLCLM